MIDVEFDANGFKISNLSILRIIKEFLCRQENNKNDNDYAFFWIFFEENAPCLNYYVDTLILNNNISWLILNLGRLIELQ